jgi:hypothetical protein
MDAIGSGKIMLTVVCMVMICGCAAVNPNSFAVSSDVVVNDIAAVNETFTPTPTPTKPEVTPEIIIPTIITPVPTATPEPTATPKPTRAPRAREPTPTPAPTMNTTSPYLQYSDDDFKVEYPSNWSVQKMTIATTYNRLNEHMRLNGDTREVIFDSGNASVSFIVDTTDLLVDGSEILKPDINLVSDMVTQQFNDVSGWSAVSNYMVRYSPLYKTPMVQYDVIIPSTSQSYPLTYTERQFVSYNHYYVMRFSTPGDADAFKVVRNRIFESLQADEIIKT